MNEKKLEQLRHLDIRRYIEDNVVTVVDGSYCREIRVPKHVLTNADAIVKWIVYLARALTIYYIRDDRSFYDEHDEIGTVERWNTWFDSTFD